MKDSPEELRQAAIAAVLKPAYLSNQVVTLSMRDGSRRSGRLVEYRDDYATHPARPMGWSFGARLEGETAMIPGGEVVAAVAE